MPIETSPLQDLSRLPGHTLVHCLRLRSCCFPLTCRKGCNHDPLPAGKMPHTRRHTPEESSPTTNSPQPLLCRPWVEESPAAYSPSRKCSRSIQQQPSLLCQILPAPTADMTVRGPKSQGCQSQHQAIRLQQTPSSRNSSSRRYRPPTAPRRHNRFQTEPRPRPLPSLRL